MPPPSHSSDEQHGGLHTEASISSSEGGGGISEASTTALSDSEWRQRMAVGSARGDQKKISIKALLRHLMRSEE